MHKQALAEERSPGLPLPGARGPAGRGGIASDRSFRWEVVAGGALTPATRLRVKGTGEPSTSWTEDGDVVAPSPERDRQPPHRGTNSPQDLYRLQFWVLLPRLSLVWVVALQQASPNTHRGSAFTLVSWEEKNNLAFTGRLSDPINPPSSLAPMNRSLCRRWSSRQSGSGRAPLRPVNQSIHGPGASAASNWPRSKSCSTLSGIRPSE